MTTGNTPAQAWSAPIALAAGQQDALTHASRALWVATLSLMSAFMQNRAPAHRYLLAKRISRNFSLLQQQDCFAEKTRASFSRLERRWEQIAQKCNVTQAGPEGGWLRRVKLVLFSR